MRQEAGPTKSASWCSRAAARTGPARPEFEPVGTVYRSPTSVAGISIGAINAALVAGNPAHTRVAKPREFWELVSSALPAPLIESQARDYEFSRLSMQEHRDAGRAGLAHTLDDPRWLHRERSATGIHAFDLTSDSPSAR
ncbi:MAG: DUF3734 domain-containing protein [Burkholderiaceae bacterium]